jgi:hypothetical protein
MTGGWLGGRTKFQGILCLTEGIELFAREISRGGEGDWYGTSRKNRGSGWVGREKCAEEERFSRRETLSFPSPRGRSRLLRENSGDFTQNVAPAEPLQRHQSTFDRALRKTHGLLHGLAFASITWQFIHRHQGSRSSLDLTWLGLATAFQPTDCGLDRFKLATYSPAENIDAVR